ncbi:MAG TPA: flagellar assembly protein FliW [Acidimicrobiales bacterium]|nr:flagellar assembly protein FliW [Acidimicrobiales bacterium]
MTDTLTVSDVRSAAAGERALVFDRALIGFPESRAYRLRSLGEAYAPFAALTSADEDGPSFIVVPPGLLFQDYVIEIPEADVAALDLRAAEDVEILALVTRRAGAAPTANLMGPIVVNTRTGHAAQVVLADGGYGVAVPLDSGSARGGAPAAAPDPDATPTPAER